MTRTVIAALLGLLCARVQDLAPPVYPGSICGFVLDETGSPAKFTGVSARYLGPHSGPYDSSKTDGTGHYCVKVRFGAYAMTADDEIKGYPALDTMFYVAQPTGPRVEVSEAAPRAQANWQIPYKAGFLHVDLKDASTGKGIKSMLLNLVVRSDETYRYMHLNTASSEVVLVPSNEDMYVSVSSEGYRSWPEDGTKGRLVSLLPGERKTLQALLNLN